MQQGPSWLSSFEISRAAWPRRRSQRHDRPSRAGRRLPLTGPIGRATGPVSPNPFKGFRPECAQGSRGIGPNGTRPGRSDSVQQLRQGHVERRARPVVCPRRPAHEAYHLDRRRTAHDPRHTWSGSAADGFLRSARSPGWPRRDRGGRLLAGGVDDGMELRSGPERRHPAAAASAPPSMRRARRSRPRPPTIRRMRPSASSAPTTDHDAHAKAAVDRFLGGEGATLPGQGTSPWRRRWTATPRSST